MGAGAVDGGTGGGGVDGGSCCLFSAVEFINKGGFVSAFVFGSLAICGDVLLVSLRKLIAFCR